MTEFDTARPSELPALAALWNKCFGDSVGWVQGFFRALEGQATIFCARVDGTPAAMFCALPAALVCEDGVSLPAAYFYAVCTDPVFRRRGLCAGLLAHGESVLHAGGCRAAALVPDGERLFAFYHSLGYRTAFFRRIYAVPARSGAGRITKLSGDAYCALRASNLHGAHLFYPPVLLDWLGQWAGLYRVETDGAVCCAAVQVKDGRCFCKELLPDCPAAAAALAAQLHCTEACVSTCGAEQAYGMVKALDGAALPARAYLGLAFD